MSIKDRDTDKFFIESKLRKNRRSGLNRRWIKSDYNGPERRRSNDRRARPEESALIVPQSSEHQQLIGFEKLLVSATIQLEALTRLLLEKKLISQDDLLEKLREVQSEYQQDDADEDA